MSRIFLPFYFNNDTSLCYRPVLNQIPFLIKELMSKKTASQCSPTERSLWKRQFLKCWKSREEGRKSCMSLKLSRGKPGHRMKFWPLKPKIKAHGGTVWDQLISWAGSRQFQDFLRTGTHCVCVSVCVTMWRQAVQTPLFSTNISICHTPLGCKKGKKKKYISLSGSCAGFTLLSASHHSHKTLRAERNRGRAAKIRPSNLLLIGPVPPLQACRNMCKVRSSVLD